MIISAEDRISDFNVEISPGFHGIYTTNTWIPISIFIETRLPSFTGRVILELPYGDLYSSEEFCYSVSKELFLTAGQKKNLQFTLPLHKVSKLKIFIKDNEETIFSETVNLSPVSKRNHRLLIPGNSTDFDFLREVIRNESIKYQTIYTHPDMLPETAAGYALIDSVVLHGTRLSGLKETRSNALRDWVENGGRLFITGSINRRGDLPSILSDFLPVDLIGPAFIDLSKSDWFSDIGTGNIKILPFARVQVRKDSTLILEADGNPVIVHREEGQGDVFYISINPGDPAYKNWKQKQAFWTYVLGLGGNSKPWFPVYNPLPKLNDLLIPKVSKDHFTVIQNSLFIFIPLAGFILLIFLKGIPGRLLLILLGLYPLLWSLIIVIFFPVRQPAYFETDIISSRLNGSSGHIFVLGNLAVHDAGIYTLQFPFSPELVLPVGDQNMIVEYAGDQSALKFYMKSWARQGFFLDAGYIYDFSGSVRIDESNITAEIVYPAAASFKYPVIYYRNNYTDDFILLHENDRIYISFNAFSHRDENGISRTSFPEYYRKFLSCMEEAKFLNRITEEDSIVLIFQLEGFIPAVIPDTGRKENIAFVLLEIPVQEFIHEE